MTLKQAVKKFNNIVSQFVRNKDLITKSDDKILFDSTGQYGYNEQ